MAEKTLLRVLRGEAVDPPPVWLMRQAGRYLPEYRETRKQAGSFLDLCYTPELAEEVTLQPIRRYAFDAAILFADILLVPQALGLDLTFVEGEGPRLSPIEDRAGLGRLRPLDEIDETLGPVYETVARLGRSLPGEVALIGFAGAPWTVATYMVAGRGTPDQAPARRFMYSDPEGFQTLIDRVTEATIHYLSRQISVGAEAVKLFDSWAAALPADRFEACAVVPARKIADALHERHPGVPVIGFPRGAGLGYRAYAEGAGVDAIAADQGAGLAALRGVVGSTMPIQGNLDPLLLRMGGEPMREAIRACKAAMVGTPYIFNLGHGITPDVDPATVGDLVETLRDR